jgi:hypothetical protein
MLLKNWFCCLSYLTFDFCTPTSVVSLKLGPTGGRRLFQASKRVRGSFAFLGGCAVRSFASFASLTRSISRHVFCSLPRTSFQSPIRMAFSARQRQNERLVRIGTLMPLKKREQIHAI